MVETTSSAYKFVSFETLTDKAVAAGTTGTTSGQATVGVVIPGSEGTTTFGYSTYVRAIYKFSIDLGFSLAVIMFIYAGYKYLTSRGESGAINDAKDILFGAVLGFATLFLIRFILTFVGAPDVGIPGVTS